MCVLSSLAMSVAVFCNLSDGIVFGVDSAVTVSNAQGVQKVFEDAEKLFKLAGKFGVATFGLAGLEGRSIGSFIREFENSSPTLATQPLSVTVEALREFFMRAYVRFAETLFGTPFDQIPLDQKGVLGLIVGGFSPGNFLSEAWEIRIPWNATPGSSRQVCGPGTFLVAWFASFDPIERYLMGFDRNLMAELSQYVEGIVGRPLTQAEIDGFTPIREKYGYRLSLDAMPIQAGIEYVKFLVQLVIQHHRFTSSHPIVGGKPKIGVVTYNEDFRNVDVS
jgi:hypothetical protein